MGAVPPNKCLRGVFTIPQVSATNLGTNTNVPVAIFVYASNIGLKAEITYQKANAEWVEISKPSTTPGVSEHPMSLSGDGEKQAECNVINQIGIKMWNLQQFQKWATDNLYAFFKPSVSGVSEAPPSPTGLVTPGNMIDAINASLADHFVLIDTNGDGVLEFHGK